MEILQRAVRTIKQGRRGDQKENNNDFLLKESRKKGLTIDCKKNKPEYMIVSKRDELSVAYRGTQNQAKVSFCLASA